jgi:hypothetical protein
MLLSAVSVFVVAQPISEVPERLVNYPVLWSRHSSVGMETRYTLGSFTISFPRFVVSVLCRYFLNWNRDAENKSKENSQWILGNKE